MQLGNGYYAFFETRDRHCGLPITQMSVRIVADAQIKIMAG